MVTPVWTDDPRGISQNVPAIGQPDLGSSTNTFGTIYAENIVATNITGDPLLPNNEFLESTNAAGTGTSKLLKSNASNATVLNTPTATTGLLQVNEVTTQSWNATAFTSPAYNLTDGSDKNHNVSTFASGTAYTITNVSAALDFGTSDPTLVLDKAGIYMIVARVNLEFVGATFAANRAVTLKLRRTNNTAADLTGGSTTFGTNIVTTVSGILFAGMLPPVFYTTANTNDIVTVFGDVAVAPTAGSLQATECNILAFRISA